MVGSFRLSGVLEEAVVVALVVVASVEAADHLAAVEPAEAGEYQVIDMVMTTEENNFTIYNLRLAI